MGRLFAQVAVQVLLVVDDFGFEDEVRQEVLQLFFFDLLKVICFGDESDQMMLVEVQHQVDDLLAVNKFLQHEEVALGAVVFVGDHDLVKDLVVVV